jgi:hypothetical protein
LAIGATADVRFSFKDGGVGMTPGETLASLVELAKRTGIRVRFDDMTTTSKSSGARTPTGGLCMVRGEPLVVLDVRAPTVEQAEILAGALSRFGVLPMYLRGRRFALRH